MDWLATRNQQRAGSAPHSSKYLPHIDGLRAVAVTAVVLCHAFPGRLPGGFTGVDVFFVISGYLITGIIISELQEGNFSLARFYARRIRRIFPALAVVLLGCMILGWFALFPDEYSELGRYIFSGAAFVANLALWQDAGYFDTSSLFKPLLHLWSLGIEEQFYIFWPVVLLVVWRFERRAVLITGVLTLLSLVWCIYQTSTDVTAAFYSPLSRAWELLIGSLLAQARFTRVPVRLSASAKAMATNVAATIGSILLLLAFVKFDSGMAFPGAYALVPTLGTALIIAAGPSSWIARYVLSVPIVIAVGLISYPLYLWHWPVLVFARVLDADGLSRLNTISAVIFSLVLAAATYLLIEKPIRFGSGTVKTKVSGLAAAMLFVAISGTAAHLTGGFPSRVGSMTEMQAQRVRTPAIDSGCEDFVGGQRGQFVYCRFDNAGGAGTIAIIGDSHAHTLFPGIAELASSSGKNTLLLANSACPSFSGVTAGFNAAGVEACRLGSERVIDFVTRHPDIKTVIISTRGALYMTGLGFGRYQTQLYLPALPADDSVGQQPPSDVFIEGLQRTVEILRQHGKSVSYFLENPEMDVNPQDCIGNVLYLRRNKSAECDAPISSVLERQAQYRERVLGITGATYRGSDPPPVSQWAL